MICSILFLARGRGGLLWLYTTDLFRILDKENQGFSPEGFFLLLNLVAVVALLLGIYGVAVWKRKVVLFFLTAILIAYLGCFVIVILYVFSGPRDILRQPLQALTEGYKLEPENEDESHLKEAWDKAHEQVMVP